MSTQLRVATVVGLFWSVVLLLHSTAQAFRASPQSHNTRLPVGSSASFAVEHSRRHRAWALHSSFGGNGGSLALDERDHLEPQVFASGYSSNPNLVDALREAVEMAVRGLPDSSNTDDSSSTTTTPAAVDLATVSVSSLYDGGVTQPALTVVPTVLEAVREFYGGPGVQHLIGSSVAGCISSALPTGDAAGFAGTIDTVELEGLPSVSVTLALLPDVNLRTFAVTKEDVPDDVGRMSPREWKRCVGLSGVGEVAAQEQQQPPDETPVFFLLPSPAFSTELDDLIRGLGIYFPGSDTIGGIASTVSSLSRAKLYSYSANYGSPVTMTDGCVGVAMEGDIQVQSLSAQGSKPVGGIYQILKAQESTIQAIVLDEVATEALELEEQDEEEDDEEEEEELDAKQQAARAYAKARIPKPVLAEANFLMRTLSDDDQAFMRRQLLIGLERGGSVGRSASELARLAEGQGHRFRVMKVASGGMKDGSVTFPLGSVEISPGTRMRFYVKDSDFAKKEIDALWLGHKTKMLNAQFEKSADSPAVPEPSCCFVIPTLDRGSKFFMGKAGYESSAVARIIPGIPCVAGFFSNGVVGKVDIEPDAPIGVQGSASGYFLLSSKKPRPVFSVAAAAAEKAARQEQKAAQERAQRIAEAEDAKRRERAQAATSLDGDAPRSEDGELILKRREVHSGRAMTVSTVEWSVAEKAATPSSVLEGFMWEKETEIDRFRERVPLANLVSQCRLSAADPSAPKPRDFIGPIKQVMREGKFVVIPECKKMEPSRGSLRRRYDVAKLAKEYTMAGAPAVSVNCDAVLFGGSMDDIPKAREAAASAALASDYAMDGVVVPPVLASDLLLYPYQLYKLRLAGADAVNVVIGALPKKDLTYLIKIASSLQLQTLATVTTEVQLQAVADLPINSVVGLCISNRILEDFSFDETGRQALDLLQSPAMVRVRQVHGTDLPVFVEGRVGMIAPEGADPYGYVAQLRMAGATGAIVGGSLAGADDVAAFLLALQEAGAAPTNA